MKVLVRIKEKTGQLIDEQVFEEVAAYSGLNPDHPDADARIAGYIKAMSGLAEDANLDYANTEWTIDEI
jgi:hypothetical protein